MAKTTTTTTTTPSGPAPGDRSSSAWNGASTAPSGTFAGSSTQTVNSGAATSTDNKTSVRYDDQGNTRSVASMMGSAATSNPQQIQSIQDELEAAGYLVAGKYHRGIWDSVTDDMYHKLLLESADTGKTPEQVIEGYKSTGGYDLTPGSRNGAVKQPLVLQLTNPEDIKKAVKDQAQNTIGRKLSDAEANAFVSLYQGMEKSYQQGVYGATGSGLPGGTGGTFEQPPSLSSFTEDQIRQRYPGEAGAHDIANAGSQFFSMLSGGIK